MTHLQLSLMPLLKKQCQVILKPLNNYNIYTALKIELAIISIREIVPFKMHLHIFFFLLLKNITSSSYLNFFLSFGRGRKHPCFYWISFSQLRGRCQVSNFDMEFWSGRFLPAPNSHLYAEVDLLHAKYYIMYRRNKLVQSYWTLLLPLDFTRLI